MFFFIIKRDTNTGNIRDISDLVWIYFVDKRGIIFQRGLLLLLRLEEGGDIQ